MSVSFAIAIYVVIWWTVLFAILPIGVRTQGEDGTIVPGTPESAPTHPRLWRVMLLTTLVSGRVRQLVGGGQVRSHRPRAIARTSRDTLEQDRFRSKHFSFDQKRESCSRLYDVEQDSRFGRHVGGDAK